MRKRARSRSLRVTDKQGAKERKYAGMALSTIRFNNKENEEKKRKNTSLGEKYTLTSNSSSNLLPAQTRKEE
jgi:hypothetical protein